MGPKKYAVVYIDEAQDLSRENLLSISLQTKNVIASVGHHQRLTGNGEPPLSFLRTALQEPAKKKQGKHWKKPEQVNEIVLRTSYRCPWQILEIANLLLKFKYDAIGGAPFLDKNEFYQLDENPNHPQKGQLRWLEKDLELQALKEANKDRRCSQQSQKKHFGSLLATS